MFKNNFSVFFTFVLTFSNNLGLEYNKNRYNQNTDFLLHEAGVNQNTPKGDNVPTQNNYGHSQLPISDFPPLRSPSTTLTTQHPQNNQHSTRPAQPSGKRDYVASNYPQLQPPTNSQHGIGNMPSAQHPQNNQHTTRPAQSTSTRDDVAPNYPPPQPSNPQNGGGSMPSTTQTHPQPNQNTQPGGKRDYVAPNYPPLRSPANSAQGTTQRSPLPQPQTSGRRDYVNPNIPSNNSPNTPQGVKVKDLINFYDSKNQQPSNPPKIPSYSSILQGPTNSMQGSTNAPANQTPKPFSYSSVVSGSTHPTSSVTTSKPSSTDSMTPFKPTNIKNPSTTRPSVLPSSIVNFNRNQGTTSGSVISDTELQTVSEELLRKDTNNAAKYITINYQGKTSSQSKEDKAQLPLLTVSSEAWNIPTIQKFVPLLDNYERDTLVNEYVTPQERNEENAFMDAIMSTTVIRHLMNYLKDKGYVTPDPRQQRDFLKQLWFSLYSRGKGKISSSGFEHSFVSELKNGEVSGLHNWIYLSKEEQANRLNYLGYLKYVELNDKGAVIKLHFNHNGVDKPVDSIFVGTSPELEMSLYTLCFVTRADNDCNLKLGGKDVNIKTYTFRYRSKNLIGSAFPQI